jgi:oxygen-independent coproporphyrinogen-3 oxidase
VRRVRRWQQAVRQGRRPLAGEETLGDRELLLETVMLRLRTAAGLDLAAVRARFGVDLLVLNRVLVERLVADGRLELAGELLRPTPAGLAVADGLAAGLRLGPLE